MNNCIFCKIINKEAEGYILFQDENVVVFLSLENHPLVAPKKHITDILELDDNLGAEIMKMLVKISKICKQALNSDGVYIAQANGKSAGQDVFHLHFHVVPTWLNTPINLRNSVPEEERKLTAEMIKKFI